jgi:hypothetical protein
MDNGNDPNTQIIYHQKYIPKLNASVNNPILTKADASNAKDSSILIDRSLVL